ncbi:ribonuclease HII [Ignisphaera sp. 4213-co]|uniref:Ribonuclease HII n=1 Tax=Ignisphaera cupida TaxID=3050454 RepID=A0ABD4Z7S8_9CREN|nr:ribonuclease HII [Ignisphaera sp. 4213-co]MDK6029294.1 ribonuclease HII [Ignisphaera sp. 4213-co]
MKTKIIAGIDEAGRGPLVGDMFIALVAIEEKFLPILNSLGVNDSKKLAKQKREKLFPIILSLSSLVITSRIQPSQIDEYNINSLEMSTILNIVKKACRIIDIEEIYIDAFTNPKRIEEKISSLNIRAKVIVEFKADSKYAVVEAASIVAKVLRDEHIKQLSKVYGDVGSGYPSDRKTIDWLKKYYVTHGEIPPIVRRSWSTIDKVLHKKN